MSADATPLKFQEKLGYGLGDTASNFFFQVFNLFLLYYYTDMFGLAPAAVGTMFLVTKVVDAISDPVMGLIADRTNSRWGKFRPYLLWAAIPYGLCGYAMFVSPDFSATGKLIYAYATYTLMMLAYTAINVPYSALMGVISPSSMERTKVASYRFICAFSAGWVIATFVTPLKNLLGGGSEETGFRLTMMIFAVISILLFWISLRRLRNECIQNRRVPISGPTFAHCSTTAHGSRCFFSGVFALTNVAMRAGATVFYFKYYVGDDGAPIVLIFDKTAVFLSLSTFALVGGVMMTQFLCRRFDKRHLMIALTLGNAVAMSAFYFIPPDQYWLMVAIGSLGTFIVGPTPALVWSMYADCADYGEWKTGRRTTGLIFSGAQFAQKLGLAVGAGLSGYVLFLFGFVSNQAQSAASLAGIRLMFSIFPAVLAVLSAVAIVFYRLSGDEVSQLEHELAERR